MFVPKTEREVPPSVVPFIELRLCRVIIGTNWNISTDGTKSAALFDTANDTTPAV
jgi:hypothetical protein